MTNAPVEIHDVRGIVHDKLRTAGQFPSTRELRDVLGRGSNTTIDRYRKLVAKELGRSTHLPSIPGLPEELNQGVKKLIEAILAHVQINTAQELQAARERAGRDAATLEAVKEQQATLQAKINDQGQALAAQEEAVEQLNTALSYAADREKRLVEEKADLKAEHTAERESARALREQLTTLNAELQRTQARLLAQREAWDDERKTVITDAEAQVAGIMTAMDAERQAVKQLTQALAAEEKRAAALARDLEHASQATRSAEERLSGANETIRSLTAESVSSGRLNATLQAKLESAQNQWAACRTENEALETKNATLEREMYKKNAVIASLNKEVQALGVALKALKVKRKGR